MKDKIAIALASTEKNQTWLAMQMGVSPQAVQQWLSEGGTRPKGQRLKKLAGVLKVQVADLLDDDDVGLADAQKVFLGHSREITDPELEQVLEAYRELLPSYRKQWLEQSESLVKLSREAKNEAEREMAITAPTRDDGWKRPETYRELMAENSRLQEERRMSGTEGQDGIGQGWRDRRKIG